MASFANAVASEANDTFEGDDLRWWRPGIQEGERYINLLAAVDRISQNNEWRKQQFEKALRLYSAVPMMAFGGGGVIRPAHMRGSRLSLNVVKAVGDAYVSVVTKDEPKVSVVTSGASWDLQQRAEMLEKFLDGQFYESRVYKTAPSFVRDGGVIFGTGYRKAYIRGRGTSARIVVERVKPFEIQIDDNDGQDGTPMCLYQRKWVDRFVLMTMYRDEPEKMRAIQRCKRQIDAHSGLINPLTSADQILVTEAWRLPSGELEEDEETDGRHSMVVATCDLEDEPWPHPWFPFVKHERQDGTIGAWGIPIAEDLEGIQVEINTLLMKSSQSIRRCGSPHVLVENGSEVNTSKLDNDEGSIIRYTGAKPEVYVPTAVVPPELYAQLDRLVARSFDMEGIPQAAAAGTIPTNLESGKAQEVYLAITDRRMVNAITNYHESYRDLAVIVLALARHIVEHENPDYAVRLPPLRKGEGLKQILLRDVDLEADEYLLKLWPTNRLADDPGARIGQVEKMADAGWVTPDAAKRLMRLPDTEEEDLLENSSYYSVQTAIADALREGQWTNPRPYWNLQQATKQVIDGLNDAERRRCPEDRLQVLRDLLTAIGETTAGIDQPQAPAQMATAPGTPMPPPKPGAAPPPGAPPGPPPPPAPAAAA